MAPRRSQRGRPDASTREDDTSTPTPTRPVRKARRKIQAIQDISLPEAVSDPEDSLDVDNEPTNTALNGKRKSTPSAWQICTAQTLVLDSRTTPSSPKSTSHPPTPGPFTSGTWFPLQPTLPPPIPRCMFLSLPRELRDEIYTHLYHAPSRLHLAYPDENFRMGTAFLRTNLQICAEVCETLYGNNEFVFARMCQRHGSFCSSDDWNEVGFKAVREFVGMIGRRNLGLIKTLTLVLENAVPCLNPAMKTADQRRYY
ncbi:uncharacterized protein LTR77_006016 [Saxophila tyrrhenica]|uniref:Uncharacterized protein n=1 Tax=Saxophila tyrrhenica TaxID=1690608 RepID=A0AAV9PAN7_9PEZI|nr:hypothetical protein LTR77_006016 [Saxophila tyrrhenica]